MADQGSKAKIYARIKNRIKHHGRERETERMADEGSQAKIYARMQNHNKHHGTQVLKEVDGEQASYMCGLCVTPGFGPRYDCNRCDNMRIHRHCASRLQLSRPCFLHPDQHHMSLVIVSEGLLQCKACNGAIAGVHYQCTREGQAVRIHPLCLLLRFEPPRGGQTPSSTVHWLHKEHPVKDLYSPKAYVCDGCGDVGIGRRLRCSEVDCDFALHPYCSSLPREVEQREPCFLCGPAGAAHGSFRTADPSWKGPCRLCNVDEISRTETAAGMHLWCQQSGLAAHPLCARLRQLEQPCRTQTSTTTTTTRNASGKNGAGATQNPDDVARVLDKAPPVKGKLEQCVPYILLANATIGIGTLVYKACSNNIVPAANVGEAGKSVLYGASDASHGASSDAVGGVGEVGTSLLPGASSDAVGGVGEVGTSLLPGASSDAVDGVSEVGTSVLETILDVLSNFF